MKRIFMATILSATLAACSTSTQEPEMLGGEKDKHGCLPAAGFTYSFLKRECVQTFNVADISLDNPSRAGSAVYVILSQDKQQAEVFAADLPENTILDAVKGGYASKDGKVRLKKVKNRWEIIK